MLPGMLIPGVAIVRAQKTNGTDGLVVLRSLFLSFATAVVLIGGVVLLLGDTKTGGANTGLGIGIVLVAAGAAFGAQVVAGRSLDGSSEQSLGGSYRTRFFLRVALSEAIALVGFVVGISIGPWWAYFVAAPLSLVSLWRIAPTRSNLAADQSELSRAGCGRSLVDVLRRSNVMSAARR
jgi:F0F1-type ATP synthase membrane subunit c/vacuolar-type H+-ATPase subunit K